MANALTVELDALDWAISSPSSWPPAPDKTWEAPAPKLDSSDANTDGLAIKKKIGSGFGIPKHWLSEPESSTPTTAAGCSPLYTDRVVAISLSSSNLPRKFARSFRLQ